MTDIAADPYEAAMAQAMNKVLGTPLPNAGASAAPAAPADDPYKAAYDSAYSKVIGSQPEAGAGAQPTGEQSPAARTFMEGLGRQLGLTARAAIGGAAALPAMAADAITGPINAALDAYDKARSPSLSELVTGKKPGFRFKRQAAALDQLLTKAGLPQPENDVERIVQDVGTGMSGAGASMATAKALTKGGGAVAEKVGEMMTASPSLQVASGATGAGAESLVREAGGGESAQMAAGIAGSLLPASKGILRPAGGSAQLQVAAEKAHANGYVVPPADLNPGPVTEVASAISGKVKTAQEASARNQQTTNALVRKALGVAEDQPLDLGALNDIRRNAAAQYQAVAQAGVITPTPAYAQAIDNAVAPYTSQAASFPNRKVPAVVAEIQSLKTPQFDAADAINTIRVVRSESDAAYRSGDKMAGGALRSAAGALEDAIEQHLSSMGSAGAQMLQQYREARQAIAQTYTIEKALNPQTGDVNAHVLARELTKGRPLTGDIRTVAEVAQAFPKAMQPLKEAPKSLSVLDAFSGTGGAMVSGNPAALALPLARPAARAALLSDPYQAQAVRNAGVTNRSEVEALPAIAAQAAVNLTPSGQPKTTADYIADIGKAETVDQAIAAAVASTKAMAPLPPMPERDQRLIPMSQRQPAEEPAAPMRDQRLVPVSKRGESVSSSTAPVKDSGPEPAVSWFGRHGAGYPTGEAAAAALRSRQIAMPDLMWQVEPLKNGRFRLAGYPAR